MRCYMGNSEKSRTVLLLIGFAAGFTNGLFGAAGGIVIVMGLRAFFRDKMANGRSFYTTALAVMLPLSTITVWQYTQKGHLPEVPLLDLLLPAVLGGATGALLLPWINPQALKRIFAVVVLVSGIILML